MIFSLAKDFQKCCFTPWNNLNYVYCLRPSQINKFTERKQTWKQKVINARNWKCYLVEF